MYGKPLSLNGTTRGREPDPIARSDKRILLVIGGGIAAYKCAGADPPAARARRGGALHPDHGGAASSSRRCRSRRCRGDKVYTDLFSLTDETEMGHIQLSREADLVVVAPATADLMAKMAQRPRQRSRHDGAARHRQAGAGRAGDERADVGAPGDAAQPSRAARPTASPSSGPNEGDMACGECGPGRMAEPLEIVGRRSRSHSRDAAGRAGPLAGRRVLVTSGPDARADRSGALHRQPLVRQAGPRHRDAAAARGRAT